MLSAHSLRPVSTDLPAVVARIVSSSGVLEAMQGMPAMLRAAAAAPRHAVPLLTEVAGLHADDPLAAYLAVHALSELPDPEAEAPLLELLDSDDHGLQEHVAWAFSRRKPAPKAVARLNEISRRGGFDQMVAELALQEWIGEMPSLAAAIDEPDRDRLVRTKPPTSVRPVRSKIVPGMRIVQVLMQGRVDGALSASGSGDGGGLATLQVGLTRELARDERVSEVFLLTRAIRGEDERFASPREPIAPGATIVRFEFGPDGYVPTPAMWPYRPELEQQLHRFLISHGPFDALHLRFADVGTFAAARVATQLGIPIFFTLAPDPHSLIQSLESEGKLTRENFARADREQHYLFRADLVNRMLDNATRLALLPRRDQAAQFRDLLGVDVASQPDRYRVIAEGVDYSLAKRAAQVASGSDGREAGVLADLRDAVCALPPERQGLPLLVSVGRLNRVKGFDRLVGAWSNDPLANSRYNTLIVGGNLDSPSAEESATLSSIRLAAGAERGLILLGNRSHEEVALILATARHGLEDVVGSNGIYVCASEKEEFGLAIVEALAAGLPVVAPRVGGPATYIEDGFTGYLADTSSIADLLRAIRWAERVRFSEVRADAARRLVRNEYSVNAMATELVSMYHTYAIRESAE